MPFQLWSGVPFGQLDVLSLWSVTEMSMLKNTWAFLTKGCCLHFISGKLRRRHYLFHARWNSLTYCEKDKGLLGKKGIKCLPWLSQLLDVNLIENLWAILDRAHEKCLHPTILWRRFDQLSEVSMGINPPRDHCQTNQDNEWKTSSAKMFEREAHSLLIYMCMYYKKNMKIFFCSKLGCLFTNIMSV